MILVPVKYLANAKQRLASRFGQAARTQLAHAMLRDVCTALADIESDHDVVLVTSDPYALEAAEKFSFYVMPDHDNPGETDAVARASRVCELRGVESTLVLPADIPLVRADLIDRIIKAAPLEGSVLVPSHDLRGTNAAFRRPANLFPLSFGADSFEPHLRAARSTGNDCVVIDIPEIALDIDRIEDLRELAERPGNTHSQKLVRDWNLDDLATAAGS